MDPFTIYLLVMGTFTSIALYVSFKSLDKKVEESEKNKTYCCYLGVIGNKQTGKTTLINALQGIFTQPSQTTWYEFDFMRNIQNDEYKIIGIDFSGSETFIKKHYKKILHEANCVLYLCNISDYLNRSKVEVDARLDYIYKCLLERTNVDVQIILTYANKIEDRESAKNEFISDCQSKCYCDWVTKNPPVLVDMTDKDEIKNILPLIDNLICNKNK